MAEPDYEPNDEEIKEIAGIMGRLAEKYQGQYRHPEDLRREAIERFGNAGYRVNVDTRQPEGGGSYFEPTVTIMGRIDPKAFDHEKQAWLVQHDVLGVDPTPGAMQRDGSIKSPSKSTSMTTKSGLILPG